MLTSAAAADVVAPAPPPAAIDGATVVLVLALVALVAWGIWREYHPRGWVDDPAAYWPTERPLTSGSVDAAAPPPAGAPLPRAGRFVPEGRQP